MNSEKLYPGVVRPFMEQPPEKLGDLNLSNQFLLEPFQKIIEKKQSKDSQIKGMSTFDELDEARSKLKSKHFDNIPQQPAFLKKTRRGSIGLHFGSQNSDPVDRLSHTDSNYVPTLETQRMQPSQNSIFNLPQIKVENQKFDIQPLTESFLDPIAFSPNPEIARLAQVKLSDNLKPQLKGRSNSAQKIPHPLPGTKEKILISSVEEQKKQLAMTSFDRSLSLKGLSSIMQENLTPDKNNFNVSKGFTAFRPPLDNFATQQMNNTTIPFQESPIKPIKIPQIRESQNLHSMHTMSQVSLLSSIDPKLEIIHFDGGSFFPSKYIKTNRNLCYFTPQGIFSRFSYLRSTGLDQLTTEFPKMNFPVNSRLHSKPKDRHERHGNEFQFISLFSQQLKEKFKLDHAFPYIDPENPEAEFYLAHKVEPDYSFHLINISEVSKSESGKSRVILMSFKIADMTLRQLMRHFKDKGKYFSVGELKILFFDTVSNLAKFQTLGLCPLSLSPDLIFYNSGEKIYYVLPVSPRSSDQGFFFLKPLYKVDQTQSTCIEKTQILGDPEYLSPTLIKSFERGYKEQQHNPFKSAAFSLGLIVLEAISLNTTIGLNKSRIRLREAYKAFPLHLTPSLLTEDEFIKGIDMFDVILAYEEIERPDFIQLYLIIAGDSSYFEDPLRLGECQTIMKDDTLQFENSQNEDRILFYADGGKYIGKVIDTDGLKIRHGEGLYENENGELMFQGVWRDNKPHFGRYFFGQEYTYEGNFKDFAPSGMGTLFYRKKLLYDGGWSNFNYSSIGRLCDTNGVLLYEGEFRLSMKHGQGRSFYKDGSLFHVGHYKNNAIYGKGTLYHPNGNTLFEGILYQIEQDQLYMKGSYYEKERKGKKGPKYVGELLNMQYHGKGQVESGKSSKNGEWQQGCEIDPRDKLLKQKSFTDIEQEISGSIEISNSNLIFPAHSWTNDMTAVEIQVQQLETGLQIDLSSLNQLQVDYAFYLISKNHALKNINGIILREFPQSEKIKKLGTFLGISNMAKVSSVSVIGSSQLTDEICSTIVAICSNKQVSSLNFKNSGPVTADLFRLLFEINGLPKLKSLKVKNPIFSQKKYDQRNSVFGEYPPPILEKLSLVNCALLPPSIKHIFQIESLFINLKYLNLSGNPISSKGCQCIADMNPSCSNLVKLNLKNCEIDEQGVFYLSNSTNLASLKSLNLSKNKVGDSGCNYLASTKVFSNLITLKLSECGISPAGLTSLANSNCYKNLQNLELNENRRLGNEAADILTSSDTLRRLVTLSIENSSITANGVVRLCSESFLPNLREIKIFGPQADEFVVEQVKEELGIKKTIILS